MKFNLKLYTFDTTNIIAAKSVLRLAIILFSFISWISSTTCDWHWQLAPGDWKSIVSAQFSYTITAWFLNIILVCCLYHIIPDLPTTHFQWEFIYDLCWTFFGAVTSGYYSHLVTRIFNGCNTEYCRDYLRTSQAVAAFAWLTTLSSFLCFIMNLIYALDLPQGHRVNEIFARSRVLYGGTVDGDEPSADQFSSHETTAAYTQYHEQQPPVQPYQLQVSQQHEFRQDKSLEAVPPQPSPYAHSELNPYMQPHTGDEDGYSTLP